MKRLHMLMLVAITLITVCLASACADPSEPAIGGKPPINGAPVAGAPAGNGPTESGSNPSKDEMESPTHSDQAAESAVGSNEQILSLSPLPDPLTADGDVFPMRFSTDWPSESRLLNGYFTGRYNEYMFLFPEDFIQNYGEVVDSYARWQELYAAPDGSKSLDEGNALLMTYDEAFFETHSLVVVFSEYGTGSLTYTGLSAAAEDGVFRIRITTHCPECITCDMACRVIVVPMEKSLGLPIEVRRISE